MTKNKENILVITYWEYNDALIQAYTLPYLKLISEIINSDSKIFLTTLEKSNNAKSAADNKIFNISFKYQKFGILGLIMWIKILFKLLILIRKEKITTIHTWCTPAGAIGYILSLITKRKLIIDSFEPHAEAMVEGKTWKRNSIAFKILFYLERLQLKRATEVICANNGMIEYSKQTYKVQKKKYYVKPACVDLDLFSINDIKDPILINELNLKNKITCVYAGKFGGLYLEEETFYFFKAAANYWGDQFVILLLTSHSDEEIKKYLEIVKLSEKHIIKKFVPHNLVPKYMGLADFAICPMKPLPCRKYSTPIKNGEYWALGLPIVITKNISDDSDLIKSADIGSVLLELNETSYIASVKDIDKILKKNNRISIYERIRPFAEVKRNYQIAKDVYGEIYKPI